jgi:hypothetical protein
VAKK